MIGDCIISHNTGWAISNECVLDTDKHLIIDGEKKISKSVLTIKISFIFDVVDKIIPDQEVECLFKTNDGNKYAFIGKVKSRGKQLTVIHELLKSDRYIEILNKVKKWQTQQIYPAG